MKARFSKHSLGYAQNIIDTVREPLLVLDSDLRVVSASRSFYQTFKVIPEETEGQFIYDLGNQQWDIPELRKLLNEILPASNTFDNYEVEHEFPDIGKKIMLLNARKVYREINNTETILLAIEDITERKNAEEKLKTLASHDELTGCVNFRSTMEFLENEIARSKRYQRKFSIIMIDIDHLKRINDECGHLAGNDVLAAFANVLKNNVRSIDIVGRYGGDEFIIALPETDSQHALVVLERIRGDVSRTKITSPHVKNTREPKLKFSAGIASFPCNARNLKELIWVADNAQLQAKKEGKNRAVLERRRSIRFNPVPSTRIEMVASSGKGNVKNLKIANISEEGMLLLSEQDILNEEHLCRICGPKGGFPFELTCKVKHKVKSGDKLYRIGVHFPNITESAKEKLSNCIESVRQ